MTPVDTVSQFEFQDLKRRVDLADVSFKARLAVTEPTLSSEEMKEVLEQVIKLSKKIEQVSNSGKPNIVSMGGYNFENIGDSIAWTKTYLSADDIGLIVDPHTVMEHIFSSVEGKDFMDSFLKIHKLKIETKP